MELGIVVRQIGIDKNFICSYVNRGYKPSPGIKRVADPLLQLLEGDECTSYIRNPTDRQLGRVSFPIRTIE